MCSISVASTPHSKTSRGIITAMKRKERRSFATLLNRVVGIMKGTKRGTDSRNGDCGQGKMESVIYRQCE